MWIKKSFARSDLSSRNLQSKEKNFEKYKLEIWMKNLKMKDKIYFLSIKSVESTKPIRKVIIETTFEVLWVRESEFPAARHLPCNKRSWIRGPLESESREILEIEFREQRERHGIIERSKSFIFIIPELPFIHEFIQERILLAEPRLLIMQERSCVWRSVEIFDSSLSVFHSILRFSRVFSEARSDSLKLN